MKKRSKSENKGKVPTEMELLLEKTQQERFITTTGNPVKEILLKLNLPDHRLILADSKEYIKIDVEVPGSNRLIRFIATCSYSTDMYKDIMKAQVQYLYCETALMNRRYITDVAASFQGSQSHIIKLSMSNHCLGRLGLRESNYDQLFAYLKQHEAHAKENKMVLDRLSQPIAQPTADPLELLSNVSNTQHGLPSSSTLSIIPLTPPRANSTDDLIENLTRTKPQYKTAELWFRMYRDDPIELLFLTSGPDNAFDDDVDEQPVQDLALNMDNVFQAEDCNAFDSDVDEAPTAQTMFMANLSSADPITDEAGPSYDSDILSEVRDHDQYLDDTCAYQEEHVMHDSVQLDHVVDLHADHMSISNMIPYDQYVKDSLTAELATYREQVEVYERRAKFELTERGQKINEQLRLVILDRNFKEET
nr:hypothetical protein [Tanacetum cinerariifolium]